MRPKTRFTLGQDGYKSHRQLVDAMPRSWWWLVLDASGESVAICDSQENADMIALALNMTRRTHVVLAGYAGAEEAARAAETLVPEPPPTATGLDDDEPGAA